MIDYKHWIEAFHIISIITWMAGMLYLPRIYVYHAQVPLHSDSYNLLNTMERKLLFYIINPSMISSITLGAVLSIITKAHYFLWFKIKIICVILMCIIQIMLFKHRQDFAAKNNTKSSLYFKCLNESVTLLIIIIVIMVVVKPFM
ncbi:CopD family protein [Ehrlichia minasensis]|uniref:Protoporphyrinogen IX oxidase n=1 Tax=Ehrlichia minasensis TaxID=1242993 RepID=A0A4Q6I456_9RICK|nr:CopD family protein [Ehrlichia minasensis]RZB12652.1 CopD family protein [Ehrlichia minasensis]